MVAYLHSSVKMHVGVRVDYIRETTICKKKNHEDYFFFQLARAIL